MTTSQKYRFLIADDHPIFRSGIKALLEQISNFEVVAEAHNGREVLSLMERHDVDVIIMDIKMPDMNGIEATELVRKRFPQVSILALSMHDEERYIFEMLQAGAQGYILKNTGKQELVTAVNTLAKGESYFSPEVSSKLLHQFIRRRDSEAATERTGFAPITKREKEVLRLICAEYTNPEIAERLSISRRTVDTHRKNLLHKLGVKNTVGLIKYAMQHGLIEEF